jgi:hypothetical protein
MKGSKIMKYTDIKILKLLQKIKDKENISYAKINGLVEEIFKPYLFEKFQPNGDIAYSKRFETLDEALEFYNNENGWWLQCITVNGKIIKHNNEKVGQTEVES